METMLDLHFIHVESVKFQFIVLSYDDIVGAANGRPRRKMFRICIRCRRIRYNVPHGRPMAAPTFTIETVR